MYSEVYFYKIGLSLKSDSLNKENVRSCVYIDLQIIVKVLLKEWMKGLYWVSTVIEYQEFSPASRPTKIPQTWFIYIVQCVKSTILICFGAKYRNMLKEEVINSCQSQAVTGLTIHNDAVMHF